jgi:hypothetical protein
LNGEELTIVNKEMHLPLRDEIRVLYLAVSTDNIAGGFRLWGIELPLLKSLDDLDRQAIHFRGDGETFDDDTLGTDIIGSDEAINTWCTNGKDYEAFQFGEMKVDFHRLKGRQYRVTVECTLSDSDEDPQDLLPEDYWASGSAEFTVEVDEKNLYGVP